MRMTESATRPARSSRIRAPRPTVPRPTTRTTELDLIRPGQGPPSPAGGRPSGPPCRWATGHCDHEDHVLGRLVASQLLLDRNGAHTPTHDEQTSESRMREIRTSGSIRGRWQRTPSGNVHGRQSQGPASPRARPDQQPAAYLPRTTNSRFRPSRPQEFNETLSPRGCIERPCATWSSQRRKDSRCEIRPRAVLPGRPDARDGNRSSSRCGTSPRSPPRCSCQTTASTCG